MASTNDDDSQFELNIEKFKQAVLKQEDSENKKYLNDVLRYFFDPNKPIPDFDDDSELLKCVSGGLACDEYLKTIEVLGTKKCCNKEISPQTFGFRCKTCSLYVTHVLCAECFTNGGHDDHDFTIHCQLSEGCDCGNPSLLKQFCKQHIEFHAMPSNYDDNPSKYEILKYAEFLLPHLVYRILQYFRSETVYEEFDIKEIHDEDVVNDKLYSPMEEYIYGVHLHIAQLMQIVNNCDLLSSKLSKCLNDEEFYQQKIQEENNASLKSDQENSYAFARIKEKMSKKVALIKYPKELEDKQLIDIECKCLMDELIIWWIHTYTWDLLSCALLFLKDEGKELFTKSYITKYCLIDTVAIIVRDRFNSEKDNFNMYFYNDQRILEKSINEYNLIETIILALYNLFQSPNLFEYGSDNKNKFLNRMHILIQKSAIHIPIKGLYNVLYHSKMGYYLLKNETLFSLWIDLVSSLQGVEIISYSSEDIFNVERQFSAVMCLLLNTCMDSTENEYTINALNIVATHLNGWLSKKRGCKEDDNRLTFILPLHRYYAGFLYKAIYKHDLMLKDLLPTDQTQLLDIISNLLQIQNAIHKTNIIKSSKVVAHVSSYLCRNGTNYSEYFVDADFFLIQCVACHLEQDLFVKTVFKAFKIDEVLPKFNEDEDKSSFSKTIYGALILLAEIIQREICLDPFDKESLKNKLVQLLTSDDYSLSEIEAEIPFTWDFKVPSKEIKFILDEIADLTQPKYTEPDPFNYVKYTLKDIYWEQHYDPLFYLYDISKDNWDAAFEKYCEKMKTKYLPIDTSKVLPPFRIPSKIRIESSKLKKKYSIANSRSLHSVLFMLLYKRLNNTDGIDDGVFHMVIYLIELALNDIEINGEPVQTSGDSDAHVDYSASNISNWFNSDNILDNIRKTVPFITVKPNDCKNTSSSNEQKDSVPVSSKEEKLIVEESMITLILKIMYKSIDENGILVVGDECCALNNLLSKATKLSKPCKELIEQTLIVLDNNKTEIFDSFKKQEDNKTEETISEKKTQKENENLENKKSDEAERDVSNMCYICQTPTIPSIDRPIGIVCSATATSVVGLRDSCEKTNIETKFSHKQKKRVELLKEMFKTDSCKESVNIGYIGGVLLESCDHRMHFDCYMMQDPDFETDEKPFSCKKCESPHCLLPIKPTVSSTIDSDKFKDDKNLTKYISDRLDAEHLYELNYLKCMFFCDNKTLERIYEVVEPENRYLDGKSEAKMVQFVNDSDERLLLTSILRIQLEVNGSKDKEEKYKNMGRSCFVSLFDLVSTRCKLLCYENKAHVKAWDLLNKPILIDKNDKIKPEVPALLRDPISMLLLIFTNLPFETATNPTVFTRIVNTTFNLVYFQNLLIAVLQMSEEQRLALSSKRLNVFNSIQDYVAFIVSSLSKLPTDEQLSIEKLKDISNDTELKLYVEELCLPFLRAASLLQYYLLGKECDEKESFNAFISNLEIQFGDTDSSNQPLLKWFDADANVILTSWLQELLNIYKIEDNHVTELLSLGKYIYSPCDLIQLPYLYTNLIKEYLNRSEASCESENPTGICLICGKYIDIEDDCVDHVKICSVVNGVFLSLFTSKIIIYNYTKYDASAWSSIYVDENGDEDNNLERGKQLFLSDERYNLLKMLWSNGSFF